MGWHLNTGCTCLLLCLAFVVLPVSHSLRQDWKDQLLRLHNEVRQKILACQVGRQPPAKNMPMLKWHNGLSSKAQHLANRCRMAHDSVAERSVPGFTFVGQNLGAARAIKAAFDSWFNEYKGYTYGTGRCTVRMCEHYTQVVWAKTNYVGCGIKKCPRSPHFFINAYLIVCNYGPAGNLIGHKPYELGGRSDCRKGEINTTPSSVTQPPVTAKTDVLTTARPRPPWSNFPKPPQAPNQGKWPIFKPPSNFQPGVVYKPRAGISFGHDGQEHRMQPAFPSAPVVESQY